MGIHHTLFADAGSNIPGLVTVGCQVTVTSTDNTAQVYDASTSIISSIKYFDTGILDIFLSETVEKFYGFVAHTDDADVGYFHLVSEDVDNATATSRKIRIQARAVSDGSTAVAVSTDKIVYLVFYLKNSASATM